jgi:tripartite-type tricarboxylate transporter receptor subunit TctC
MAHASSRRDGTPCGARDVASRVRSIIVTPAGPVNGRLRALAVSGSARSSAAPDVPTVAESGVPGYDFDVWYGMLFPAGTPQLLIEQANRDIRRALQSASLQQRFTGLGVQAAGNTADEFRKLIAAEVEKWNKVVAAAHIKLH